MLIADGLSHTGAVRGRSTYADARPSNASRHPAPSLNKRSDQLPILPEL